MENQSILIAQTILKQIQYTDRIFLSSIKANNFLALPETKQFSGGLRFGCNARNQQGVIEISLRWVDDYTVSFLNVTGDEIKSIEGVYCDMLVDIVSSLIEE